jgi:hypothetical protein
MESLAKAQALPKNRGEGGVGRGGGGPAKRESPAEVRPKGKVCQKDENSCNNEAGPNQKGKHG